MSTPQLKEPKKNRIKIVEDGLEMLRSLCTFMTGPKVKKEAKQLISKAYDNVNSQLEAPVLDGELKRADLDTKHIQTEMLILDASVKQRNVLLDIRLKELQVAKAESDQVLADIEIEKMQLELREKKIAVTKQAVIDAIELDELLIRKGCSIEFVNDQINIVKKGPTTIPPTENKVTMIPPT